MGKSREFDDLAGRFGARAEPVERVLPGPVRQTQQQLKKSSAAKAQERSKKFSQWHREGHYFEEVRRSTAEQQGLEPGHWNDPWKD